MVRTMIHVGGYEYCEADARAMGHWLRDKNAPQEDPRKVPGAPRRGQADGAPVVRGARAIGGISLWGGASGITAVHGMCKAIGTWPIIFRAFGEVPLARRNAGQGPCALRHSGEPPFHPMPHSL